MTYSAGQSQGLSNIFNQKAADLKSKGKQIALLQLYIGWIEKGYAIARAGLTTIGEIKKGDFNLNNVFFSSLSSVNPAIKKCSKVAAVLDLVQSIKKEFIGIESLHHLSPAELAYLLTVKEGMFEGCAKGLQSLNDLMTSNTYEMSDDERIKKIDEIYYEMLNKSLLAREFNREARMVSQQRVWDELNIQTLKNLQ